MADSLSKEVKETSHEIERIYKFQIREFYEWDKIIRRLKTAHSKGDHDKRKKYVKLLRSSFGPERVEKKEMREFGKMKEKFERMVADLEKTNPAQAERFKLILNKITIYNNFFIKSFSRGGELEQAITNAKEGPQGTKELLGKIETVVKRIPAFEELLKVAMSSLKKDLWPKLKNKVLGENKLEKEVHELIEELENNERKIEEIRQNYGNKSWAGNLFRTLGGGNRGNVKEEKELTQRSNEIIKEILPPKIEILKKQFDKTGKDIEQFVTFVNQEHKKTIAELKKINPILEVVSTTYSYLWKGADILRNFGKIRLFPVLNAPKLVLPSIGEKEIRSLHKEQVPELRRTLTDFLSNIRNSAPTIIPLENTIQLAQKILKVYPQNAISQFLDLNKEQRLEKLGEMLKPISKLRDSLQENEADLRDAINETIINSL